MEDKQNLDWSRLMAAADQMENPPGCENYPDAFFPEKGSSNLRAELIGAKAICRECPIRKQCADYGIRWEEFGIWGGLTAKDRKKLRLAVRRAS